MSFIETIVDFFKLIGQAIFNLVDGLSQLFELFPKMLVFSGTMTAFLPGFLVSFFIAGFTVKIVLVIIGRK